MQFVLNELARTFNDNAVTNFSGQTLSGNMLSLNMSDDNLIENDLNNNENIDLEPDGSVKRLNILCCIMCQNDSYLIETLLAPIFNQSFYHKIASISANSIVVETFNSLKKQIVNQLFFGLYSK
jgi:hypothetical protein